MQQFCFDFLNNNFLRIITSEFLKCSLSEQDLFLVNLFFLFPLPDTSCYFSMEMDRVRVVDVKNPTFIVPKLWHPTQPPVTLSEERGDSEKLFERCSQ